MTIGSHHLAMLLNLIYSGKDPRNQNPIYFSAEGAIRALDDPTFIFDHAAGQCILDQT